MEFVLDDKTLTQLQHAQIDLTVKVKAHVNVTPFTARQKVNGLLLDKAGTGLMGGTPALVVAGGRLLWRIPVILALPERPHLGEVGTIDVDVQTAEVLLDPVQLEQLKDRADALATRTSH
jgi:hypothetical protein